MRQFEAIAAVRLRGGVPLNLEKARLATAIVAPRQLEDDDERQRWLAPVPLAVVLLGMYLLSGMRAYYGLMILGLFAGVVAVRWTATMIEQRRVPWRRTAASVLIVATMWVGCRLGGGPYYESLVDPMLAPVTSRVAAAASQARAWLIQDADTPRPRQPSASASQGGGGLVSTIERSRRGFELTVGGTNMAPPELDRSLRSGFASCVQGLLLGVAAVFVPVTVLKAAGVVSFSGGGRLLLLTDADTVFLDLAILVDVRHLRAGAGRRVGATCRLRGHQLRHLVQAPPHGGGAAVDAAAGPARSRQRAVGLGQACRSHARRVVNRPEWRQNPANASTAVMPWARLHATASP